MIRPPGGYRGLLPSQDISLDTAFLRKIPLTYSVNLNWLLTGEGSMFLDEKQEEVLRLAEQIQQLSPEHRKLIKEYIEVQLHEK